MYDLDYPKRVFSDNVNWLCNHVQIVRSDVANMTQGLITKPAIDSVCSGRAFCSSRSLVGFSVLFGIEPYQLLNPKLPEIYDEIKQINDKSEEA